MRLLLLLAALCAAVLPARACDALILIQGSRAGEPAAGLGVRQPTWVLWPYSAPPRSANELLSVTTGLDWYGDLDLLSFTSGGVRRWRSLAGQSLARRGYFRARAAFLQGWPVELLSNAPDTVSQPALVLALDGNSSWVTVLPFHSVLPSKGLIVYDARGWDDATSVARRCGGRAMVVEYPQGACSRFWMYGRGWLEGPWVPTDAALGVPGLIAASHLLSLIRSPSGFALGAPPGPNWRGADQWLERASGFSPIAEGVMYGILAVAIFTVLWRINIERNARMAKTALCMASLLPAADLLAGNVARWMGFGWWWPALCLTWMGGLAISIVICRRQLLLGCCLIGVLICAVANPLWSDFSAVLGSRQLPPEGLGLLLAYTAAFSSLAVEQGRAWLWISRLFCFGVLVYGAFGSAWWCFGSPGMMLVPAIGWLSGEGLMGWELLGLTALGGFAFSGLPDSLVWTPHGLLYNLSDRSGYDVSSWALFLASPGFLGTLSLFGGFVIYTAGFVAYRLGRAIREHPAFGSSFQSLGGMLALCLSTPAMLAALIPAIIGVLAVLAYGAGED